MKTFIAFSSLGILAAAAVMIGGPVPASAGQGQAAATGSITGRVHLTGTAPGNTVIRMGMDPKCSQANAGKQVVQAVVVANAKGDLANAFVSLKGTFPKTPAPAVAVTLDQKGCVFVPRVIGARVGQKLEIKTSDAMGHNAHGQSNRDNTFNLMQTSPTAGSMFQLKSEEVMLKITCDLHSWMVAYIGVVDHPYFSVTGETGTFTIDKVPAGTQTVQVWHERYGPLTKTVTVAAGKATTVDFAYTGAEAAPRGALQELTIPGGNGVVQLVARLR